MAICILIDANAKREIGRQPINPLDRYNFYQRVAEGQCWAFQGRYWKIHTAAWKIPEEELVLTATFDSWETSYCDCD